MRGAFIPPAPLGVGVNYLPMGTAAMEACREVVDFFELSPDVLCHELEEGGRRRMLFQPPLLERALRITEAHPLVVHGLGLSMGSAHGWNEGYLELLDTLRARRSFAWHSEHLGYLLATDAQGREFHAGIPLPLPFTEEALDLLVPRGRALAGRYGVPFLLENLTWYLPDLPSDGGRDEVAFLNDFAERAGCGLLFDLYNFHCNATNLGFDPYEALGRLRLDRVVQVHVAGGTAQDGFLMDVHSRTVPEPVWEMLEWLVPRAPNLAGVQYEVQAEALVVLGVDTILEQVRRAKDIWSRGSRLSEGGRRHGAA